MSKKIDLTGQRFGKYVVVCEGGKRGEKLLWRCRCDCGKVSLVTTGNLRRGNSKSCGKCNTYTFKGETAICTTHNGKTFVVDAEDVARIDKHTWYITSRGYVATAIKGITIHLHRFLLNAPPGVQVDHINIRPNDCRKDNLRLASPSQNTQNRRCPVNNTTGYKGVARQGKRYITRLGIGGRTKHISSHDTAKAAAIAYNEAAIKHYGEFAHLNLID